MKKLSVWLLCSLLLAGCAHEELDLQQSVGSPDYSVKISPEEAILRASLMIDKLDGTQTRLGGKRTVKDVKLLGNLTADRHTRSDNGVDSLFYLINFEDDQGFALMSADRRTLPVYALSETGSLTEEDMKRDGLKQIMAGITADAIIRINNANDSISEDWVVGPNPTFPGPGDLWYQPDFWVVGPRLKGNQARLGAGAPFNKYCRTASGNLSNSGCTAVAAAAIMWYYKWPNSYKDYTFDWDDPEADDFDTLAKLIHAIGFSENLNVSYYGTDYPMSASPANIPRTLKNMGYTSPLYEREHFFEKESFMLEVLDNEPIYFSGFSKIPQPDGSYKYDGGHSWVIDGYYAYYDDQPHDETIPFQRMYHCVWGWDGDSNGYYYIANKKAFIGMADMPDSSVPEDNKIAINVYYNLNFEYYYGMRPNK